MHMLPEEIKIKLCLRGKRFFDIAEEVDGYQTAAVIRAERYLPAGIGGDRLITQISVAVRDALVPDGIPEEHARLGRFPCVMNNLVPELACINILYILRIFRIDGVLLAEAPAVNHRLHKIIGYLD
jgi:hypothetical protein